jgi:hypothetical protein
MPGEVSDSAEGLTVPQCATRWLLQVCQRFLSSSLVAWLQQRLLSAPAGQHIVGGEQQQAGSCSRPEEALAVQQLEASALQQGLPLPQSWLQALAREACRLGAGL